MAGLALISADQGLKRWSALHLRFYERIPIFPGWLHVSRVANEGLAGDRATSLDPSAMHLFTRYLPLIALVALFGRTWRRWRRARAFERAGLAILLAGGASNLADHFRLGYVLDVLQLRRWDGLFVPFNLADSGILLGTILVSMSLVEEVWALEARSSQCSHYSAGFPITYKED